MPRPMPCRILRAYRAAAEINIDTFQVTVSCAGPKTHFVTRLVWRSARTAAELAVLSNNAPSRSYFVTPGRRQLEVWSWKHLADNKRIRTLSISKVFTSSMTVAGIVADAGQGDLHRKLA